MYVYEVVDFFLYFFEGHEVFIMECLDICVYLHAVMLEVALFFNDETFEMIPLLFHLFSYHEQYQPVGRAEF
jgi:hypothetical protein